MCDKAAKNRKNKEQVQVTDDMINTVNSKIFRLTIEQIEIIKKQKGRPIAFTSVSWLNFLRRNNIPYNFKTRSVENKPSLQYIQVENNFELIWVPTSPGKRILIFDAKKLELSRITNTDENYPSIRFKQYSNIELEQLMEEKEDNLNNIENLKNMVFFRVAVNIEVVYPEEYLSDLFLIDMVEKS